MPIDCGFSTCNGSRFTTGRAFALLHCICACPNGAIHTGPGRVDRTRCQACGSCAQACPNEALRLIGYEQSVEQVIKRTVRDRPYYEATGGGVTLSGGQPLLQPTPWDCRMNQVCAGSSRAAGLFFGHNKILRANCI